MNMEDFEKNDIEGRPPYHLVDLFEKPINEEEEEFVRQGHAILPTVEEEAQRPKGLFKPSIVNGAYILMDNLVRMGIKYIFGYPGGAILPIYDELYLWEERKLIKHFLVRHEQASVHAADAYSRSTGKLGVCFATSGPGATNLVTGLATAHMDSVPLLAITGQVGTKLLGTDAFQETDIIGITVPIVKHSYLLKKAHQIPYAVCEGIYIAKNGRPGPVVIDIPKDVGTEKLDYTLLRQVSVRDVLKRRPHFRYKTVIDPEKIQYFFNLTHFSRRPLFYVGGGVVLSNSYDEFQEMLKIFNIPVTTTLMGKGAIADDHPLNLGMLGMHGTAPANFAVSQCDLLIALGARFDDRVTGKISRFAPNAVIIHIDIDPAEFSKNKRIHLPITGNLKVIFQYILQSYLTDPELVNGDRRYAWHATLKDWKEKYPLIIPELGKKLSAQYVIKSLSDNFKDAIYTTDVGQHQMWCAQFLQLKPRHWCSSAGLGTMGYGLPAAIGAQVQDRDKTVICVSGDASIQMNIQEFGTLAQYKIPIILIIINNGWQGMVRQWQQQFYKERYSHSNMQNGAPDFIALAASYGLEGINVTTPEELKNVLQSVKERKRKKIYEPLIVNCAVVEDDNCYPMVKPGESNTLMDGVAEKEMPKDILAQEQEAKAMELQEEEKKKRKF